MDRIRNEIIRGATKVGEISKNEGTDMSWEGTENEWGGGMVMRMEVEERTKGRTKRRWMDSVNIDLGRMDNWASRRTVNRVVWMQLGIHRPHI